jgi:hypothetical protein
VTDGSRPKSGNGFPLRGNNSIEMFQVALDPTSAVVDFSITTAGVTTCAPSAIPEPGRFLLLGSGFLGHIGLVRRKIGQRSEIPPAIQHRDEGPGLRGRVFSLSSPSSPGRPTKSAHTLYNAVRERFSSMVLGLKRQRDLRVEPTKKALSRKAQKRSEPGWLYQHAIERSGHGGKS